jgi:hypothetical protein
MARKSKQSRKEAPLASSGAVIRKVEIALARLLEPKGRGVGGRPSAARLARAADISRATLYRVPGIVARLKEARESWRNENSTTRSTSDGMIRKRDGQMALLREEISDLRRERDTLAQHIQLLTLQLQHERTATRSAAAKRRGILPLVPTA